MIREAIKRLIYGDRDRTIAKLHERCDEISTHAEWARNESLSLRSELATVKAERDAALQNARPTHLTPAEERMLGIVRDFPGGTTVQLAKQHAAIDPDYPTNDPNWYILQNHAKHLTDLFLKGHVRREKSGRSFRYWPAGVES